MCLQLDSERLEKIPILKKLRALEEQAGKDVTLGAAPPAAHQSAEARGPSRRRPRRNTPQDAEGEARPERRPDQRGKPRPPRARKDSRGDGENPERGKGRRGGPAKERRSSEEAGGEVTSQRKFPATVTTVYLGGIPAGLRVSELKVALREREAAPLKLTWQGAQHRAFLDYVDPQAAEQALQALQDLSLNGHSLQAELAKSQRGGRRSGQPPGRRPRAAPKSEEASAGGQSEDGEKTEQEQQ